MFGVKQKGLTLIELLISVVVLGILMAIIGPIFSTALTFMNAAKKSEIQLNNQKLASGMLSYARNHNGKLPPEWSSHRYVLYNKDASPAAAADQRDLFLELTGAGVPPNQINTAGYGVDAVKRYQMVSGLKYEQPLFFNMGDKVALSYEVGVIYQSECSVSSNCVNEQPPTGGGGVTPRLTKDNIASWDVGGADYAPIMINTLAEQKAMLKVTIGRLNRLSDRISSNYYALTRAAGNTGTNYFAGANAQPLANHINGCWVAWDNLSVTNTLASIGLSKGEYGKTAWDGVIEYCRDYKPNGTRGGQPPFYAALRINKDLGVGNNPVPVDVVSPNNKNVIVTF